MNTLVMFNGVMKEDVSHNSNCTNFSQQMQPEKIGARLRLLRLALNYKPSEMADAIGIERTYWSRFEGGKRAISREIAAMIVEKFDVTLDFVILGIWRGLPLELANKMRDIEKINRDVDQ